MTYIKYADASQISRDEWLELRKSGIGGSDAGAIMGVSPYKSAYSVWADKIGKLPPADDSEPMRQGRDLEDYVAKRFSEKTGFKVKRNHAMMRSVDHPCMVANIDRQIIGMKAGLECKTSRDIRMTRYKNGEYPLEYYAQCLHYLAVTGWDKWYLAVLVYGTDLLIFEINRNDVQDDINALVDAEEAFWRDFVMTRHQPLPDGMDSTTAALSAVWSGTEHGKVIDAKDDSDILLDSLAKLKKDRDLIDDQITIAQNRIKAIMGDAEELRGTSARATWKTVTQRRLDKKLVQMAVGDISTYEKEITSRRFELKTEED